MTEEAVYTAVAQAAKAFDRWKKTSYGERADLLHKVSSLMRDGKSALVKIITMEMGKLLSQAEGEITLTADVIDYYATNGARFLADKSLKPEHGHAFIRYSPMGVLLGVAPWNFPFYQVARFAAPNIMIGKTVLVKHASIVPECGILLEDLFREAGAPYGVYTNLLMSGERASALVADERIKGVSLTGSEAAGASIAAAAGKYLKKSVLELGGSDAFIILEDADIDQIGVHGKSVTLHLETLWSRNISITTRLVDTVTTPMLFKTVQSKKIEPKKLITHRFKLDQMIEAYDTFEHAAKEKALKVILENLMIVPMKAINCLLNTTSNNLLGDTLNKTGVRLEDLAAPYYVFRDAGEYVTIASPKGGLVPLDPICKTKEAENFDLTFIAGGYGAMWDFPGNEHLKHLLDDFFKQGKPVGLVGHAVVALIELKARNGEPLVKGRGITGFSNREERLAGLGENPPILLETKLLSPGAYYRAGADFSSYVVVDENIITGQNPGSAVETATRLLEWVHSRKRLSEFDVENIRLTTA